jgi:hypothetical protein
MNLKSFFPLCTLLLWGVIAHTQDRYAILELRLDTTSAQGSHKLSALSQTESIGFVLPRLVNMLDQAGFFRIDSQLVQLVLLQIDSVVTGKTDEQSLRAYATYEMDYLRDEVHIPLINPQTQWVRTPSGRGWLVWYFRVGKITLPVEYPVEIQLYASTLLGDKVLTINAPIMQGANFGKAGMLVNGLMETMTQQPR